MSDSIVPNGSLRLPIRTARLILRDLESDDFDVVHAYGSDPEVTRYMFYGPRTEAETRDYLDRMIASQRERPRMVWELGVLRANDHRLIGTSDLSSHATPGVSVMRPKQHKPWSAPGSSNSA